MAVRDLSSSANIAAPNSEPMLFYVADWLPPDFGAVGQYALRYAEQVARSGQKVCLIGLTSGRARVIAKRFTDSGTLEIRFLSAKRYNKTEINQPIDRSLRTDARLMWEVIRDRRSRGAELLFTGSPPFMLFFAIWAKWIRGARLVYRMTDFYPEVLIAAIGKTRTSLTVLSRIPGICAGGSIGCRSLVRISDNCLFEVE